MCYYTNDYYLRCRHQPLILQSTCQHAHQYWGLRPDPCAAHQELIPASAPDRADNTRRMAFLTADKISAYTNTMEFDKPKPSLDYPPEEKKAEIAEIAERGVEAKQKIGLVLRPCGEFVLAAPPRQIGFIKCPRCFPEPHVFLGRHDGFRYGTKYLE
ncbi:hypothetical protein RUND412_007996 [Rhizina undulata]